MLLLGIAMLIAAPALAAVVAYHMAEDREEEMLFVKLFGYGLLGYFTFQLNGFPLPLGFGLALWLVSRADLNQKARRLAAIITFALFLLGELSGIAR